MIIQKLCNLFFGGLGYDGLYKQIELAFVDACSLLLVH
jgi:hypothetical protein